MLLGSQYCFHIGDVSVFVAGEAEARADRIVYEQQGVVAEPRVRVTWEIMFVTITSRQYNCCCFVVMYVHLHVALF